MKIDEIKTIVKLMSEHDLSEVKIENNGDNICIKRGNKVTPVQQVVSAAPQAVAAPAVAAPVVESAPNAAPAVPERTISSPLVGTFYRCASPDSPPLVKAGDVVNEDTVVGIIEAMKVMNEVKAEISGTIKECLIENGQPVEFGQNLFVIE